ncbi:unnamed protein product [Soboliphyme baturini]|uniref:Centaurin-gamma-1A n=1 Tax=Soboliphyme baturini TaxID=241478 RepID=A0A183IV77_9BILA|nr:unnamed protein product [Soboliphyme baturini]
MRIRTIYDGCLASVVGFSACIRIIQQRCYQQRLSPVCNSSSAQSLCLGTPSFSAAAASFQARHSFFNPSNHPVASATATVGSGGNNGIQSATSSQNSLDFCCPNLHVSPLHRQTCVNITCNSPSSATPNQCHSPMDHEFRPPMSGGVRERTPAPAYDFSDQLPTPLLTPNSQRKNRRISNIFNRKDDDKGKIVEAVATEIGGGRAIPVKQGVMYKRSSKSLNKEWKKKYVCLYSDGRLSYYPNIKDYMDDVHGKEISLGRTTVKVPRKKPNNRFMVKSVMNNGVIKENAALQTGENDAVQPSPSFQESKTSSVAAAVSSDTVSGLNMGDDSSSGTAELPAIKKKDKGQKHVRKSAVLRSIDADDSDENEFVIVSLDNRQWHFEAPNVEPAELRARQNFGCKGKHEDRQGSQKWRVASNVQGIYFLQERDQWVHAIEQQILSCLQGNQSNKNPTPGSHGDRSAIQSLRNVTDPDWASLNLGALICIQCSGIHRNLGTHISRVRSLDLDEWPIEHINVMRALGNDLVNSIWEHDLHNLSKPSPNSSR